MMLQGNVYVHVVNMKRAAVECYFRDVSILAFTSSVVIVFYVVFTCNPFIDDVGWMTDRTVLMLPYQPAIARVCHSESGEVNMS